MQTQGQKIYLQRNLAEEIYPQLLQWIHDLEVMRYVYWVREGLNIKDVVELKKFIADIEGTMAMIFSIYAIDGNFIGYTSLCDFEKKDSCEYSIFIFNKDYWGQGIGQEVTKLMLDYAFIDLQMEKVLLATSEQHQQAIRLYEKMGFQLMQKIPNDRTIFHQGQWQLSGSVEMEIRRDEWLNPV